MRALPFAALFVPSALASVLVASSSFASPTYPTEIQNHLSTGALEQCTICHLDNTGGTGTAVKDFALAMKGQGLTGGSNFSSLDSALDALKAAKTDTDGDGVPDVQELINGTDPNVKDASAGEGEGEGSNPGGPGPGQTNVPKQIEYGFGCSSSSGASSLAGIGALGVMLALVGRRRR